MRVSVFGLGYVGSVSAAAFAADGHEVVGVDVERRQGATRSTKDAARSSNQGSTSCCARQSPADGCARRRAPRTRCSATDLSLVCVGTPSRKNGSLDLTYLTSRLRADRRASSRQARLPRRRHPQHRAPGHDARPRHSGARGRSGKKYGEGFGVVGQSRVPARGNGAQGLPPAAADAGRPQPRGRRRADQGALRRTSRRRSSAPASASPR